MKAVKRASRDESGAAAGEKDGSKIWTRFALSKVSAEGKVYYGAGTGCQRRNGAKEQTRQLIIAVDHLDRPVIVLDPERHIVQCNRAFTEMFGYCISEASGMQPDTLLNIPEFPADNRIRLQQLLWKTARDQDEFLLLTRTGEKSGLKPLSARFMTCSRICRTR